MTHEVHNPKVDVGNVRRIAVRGLIRGHEGSWIALTPEITGILKRFYHRTDGYSEVVLEDGYSVALWHLTEIGIKA